MTRPAVIVLLFCCTLFFLWSDGSSSILKYGLYGHQELSEYQNQAVNLFCAFGFATLSFLSLLWFRKRFKESLTSVRVTETSIAAPNQGFSGRSVEIPFADITDLEKLSIDGVWEFNVSGRDQEIRVPKASLLVPDDFDKLVLCVQKRAPNCELKTEQRITPPSMNN